jgi:RNA polymerase sigma-70 factor (ECF subfamily)
MVLSDSELDELTRRVAQSDQVALGRLLEWYRPRLRAMIQFRMAGRVRNRLDASDILQEAFLEVALRLPEFVHELSVPFYVWLRRITGQRLAAAFRAHLGTQGRAVGRETALFETAGPAPDSTLLAAHLVGRLSSPSHAALRAELAARLDQALNRLGAIDREIIVLRHFEELTNSEVAKLLDLKPSAVSNRHVRALERLRVVLDQMPEFFSELQK